MSSTGRVDHDDPPIAAQGTTAEIDDARHDVEQAILRLQRLGVDVMSVTEHPEIADDQAEAAALEQARARAAQERRRRDDIEHADAIAAELADARRRAGRLFGRKAAKRVISLELAERLARENVTPAPAPLETAPGAATGDGVVDLDELEQALAELKAADDQLDRLLLPWDPKAPRRHRPWRPVTFPDA